MASPGQSYTYTQDQQTVDHAFQIVTKRKRWSHQNHSTKYCVFNFRIIKRNLSFAMNLKKLKILQAPATK